MQQKNHTIGKRNVRALLIIYFDAPRGTPQKDGVSSPGGGGTFIPLLTAPGEKRRQVSSKYGTYLRARGEARFIFSVTLPRLVNSFFWTQQAALRSAGTTPLPINNHVADCSDIMMW